MGYRAEHEGPVLPETDKTESYSPNAEEEKTIKMVNKYFHRAKKERSKIDKDWVDYYKIFRGVQWKERKPAYRSTEVMNLVFRHIQSVIPIMTAILASAITSASTHHKFSPQEARGPGVIRYI